MGKNRSKRQYSHARVARCVIEKRQKNVRSVLLVLSAKRDEWEFPGGKLGRDETYEMAAKRELYEETGHRTLGLKLMFIWRHDVVSIDGTYTTRTIKRYFRAKIRARSDKSPVARTDVTQHAWFTLDTALALPNIKHETRVTLELLRDNAIGKSASITHTTRFDPRLE